MKSAMVLAFVLLMALDCTALTSSLHTVLGSSRMLNVSTRRVITCSGLRCCVRRRYVCVMTGTTAAAAKRKMVKIGTHNGTFHCDEALGCFLLQQTPEYKSTEIQRSRKPEVLQDCDIVIDVGGVYDPSAFE